MIAVHAHPDDESSKGGATMAKYAADGVRVVVATFTGGERGDVLNPKLAADPVRLEELRQNLPAVRRREMAEAASVLGVEQYFLGFEDSGLPEGDPPPPLPAGSFATLEPKQAAFPLVKLIREVRPQVLTTYDPSGGYPHPDHVQTHKVSLAALDLAADEAYHPEVGAPFAVPKVYYDQGISLDRIEAVDAAMRARGLDSPFGPWLARRPGRKSKAQFITTRVPVADFFGVRDAALRAHATQVDPEGWFFAIPPEIEREVWPHEDFELVRSAVPATVPEVDLFAGLR
ncbi:MAG: mycothiol conjugate amidase Mca [Bifidobacteriaceae bacterium]|jgi:mycothiol S-conjugate amidase|nr:mycothiol conjugate amidase Mca [Bifidobacteriaceae bacterium]